MPFDFHLNRDVYLQHQVLNTRKSIIPFIQEYLKSPSLNGLQVLEMGCGEGGNLLPFHELGAICTGIDLNREKIEQGIGTFQEQIKEGSIALHCENIYSPNIEKLFTGKFDIIILKDVIEHLHEKEKALAQMAKYLSEDGLLFIGWPPWYMPFGGHQQICQSKILRVMPWIHLLPKPVYASLLTLFGEPKEVKDELLDIVDTRCTISRFNKAIKAVNLLPVANVDYFINPIYEFKFGLKTRKQFRIISKIPVLRDFMTTSCYYLLKNR